MAAAAGLPRPLLLPPLRALGSRPDRAASGGAGRSRPFALLFLLHRALAAGGLLFHRPADPRLARACSSPTRCSGASGAAISARRRCGPTCSTRSSAGSRATGATASSSTPRPGPTDKIRKRVAETCDLAGDRLVDRRRLGALFLRRADAGRTARDASGVDRRLCLDRHPHRAPPIIWPAICASRYAYTCAPGRASRLR